MLRFAICVCRDSSWSVFRRPPARPPNARCPPAHLPTAHPPARLPPTRCLPACRLAPAGWLDGCLAGWPAGWLAGWVAGWLLLAGWLAGCSKNPNQHITRNLRLSGQCQDEAEEHFSATGKCTRVECSYLVQHMFDEGRLSLRIWLMSSH